MADQANTTIVNWCLGNTCNYRCSYCPDILHSGSVNWVSYDKAIGFCEKLIRHYRSLGQQPEFLFTGGEPTMYPAFVKLLTWLKERGFAISIISNGSRTVGWWEKNVHLLDTVILTYHSEYADNEHFTAVVRLLGARIPLHINFTMLPANFSGILEFENLLHQQGGVFTTTLKPLLVNFGSQLYDYTPEQLKILQISERSGQNTTRTGRSEMKKILQDRSETLITAADLILRDENHWKGWKCYAGVELVYIDFNGDVYRGTCKQGGRITNIYEEEDFSFPSSFVTCGKSTCHCLSDITTSKEYA